MIRASLLRGLVVITLTVLLVCCGGPPAAATRVLFIGNSYTFQNDLPQMLSDLAAAGNHPLIVDMAAVGGATLAQHLTRAETRDKLDAQPWGFVVLQEQSVIPALPGERTTQMYPALRQFTQAIRGLGARPVLLLTWGRQEGLPEFGYRDYQSMQAELTIGYMTIAEELNVIVAPVGIAWQIGVAHNPELALWEADGSHPSQAGSYLAACTLYATIYQQSPVGLPAPRGLSEELAQRLQILAQHTVLDNPTLWHIQGGPTSRGSSIRIMASEHNSDMKAQQAKYRLVVVRQ